MVEYVLGGSPTNKESPLAGLEPRLHALKFDDNDKVSVGDRCIMTGAAFSSQYFPISFLQTNDDKDKDNSPFDTNGLKKDDQVNTNGIVANGIDDDKGFK